MASRRTGEWDRPLQHAAWFTLAGCECELVVCLTNVSVDALPLLFVFNSFAGTIGLSYHTVPARCGESEAVIIEEGDLQVKNDGKRILPQIFMQMHLSRSLFIFPYLHSPRHAIRPRPTTHPAPRNTVALRSVPTAAQATRRCGPAIHMLLCISS